MLLIIPRGMTIESVVAAWSGTWYLHYHDRPSLTRQQFLPQDWDCKVALRMDPMPFINPCWCLEVMTKTQALPFPKCIGTVLIIAHRGHAKTEAHVPHTTIHLYVRVRRDILASRVKPISTNVGPTRVCLEALVWMGSTVTFAIV